MKTEEGRKAFARVKSIIGTSEQVAPTAVSDVCSPFPCLPFCATSQLAMVWGS